MLNAVDLLPTFCEVTGAKMPHDYAPDGESILDVLQGNRSQETREKPLFWKIGAAWPPDPKRPDHWVSWAVVKGRWKLVSNQDLSHLELFDIAGDVGETCNLKEERIRIAEDLLAELKRWQATLPKEPTGNVFSNLRQDL